MKRSAAILVAVGLASCNPNGNPQPTPPSVVEYRIKHERFYVNTVQEGELDAFGFTCDGRNGIYYDRDRNHSPIEMIAVVENAEECSSGVYSGASKVSKPFYDMGATTQCHNGRMTHSRYGPRKSRRFVVVSDDRCVETRLVVTE